MLLTAHFSLEEFTESQTAVRLGIPNDPPPAVVENLRRVARALENVRIVLANAPLRISSGYRSLELNAAVHGSRSSAHLRGLAVDFTAPSYGTPREVALAISRSTLLYDQVIYEGAWVHFALAESSEQRMELLTAHFVNGVAHYEKGIVA